MTSIIFIILHQPNKVLENDILVPIFVNEALNPNSSYKFTDNKGKDNISKKNADYCELTAMYWAWKNLDKTYDYVGFFHYRRYLSFKNNLSKYFAKFVVNYPTLMDKCYGFSAKNIENSIKDYDIILPKKHLIYDHNLGRSKQFKYVEYIDSKNPKKLFTVMAKVIIDKYPAMEKVANSVYNSNSAYFKNMFIMKRKYFNQYMDFAFTVLFAIEVECQKNKIEMVAREMGFLAEYLVNIYVAYLSSIDKSLKIKELPIVRMWNFSLSSSVITKYLIKIKKRMKLSYFRNFFRN